MSANLNMVQLIGHLGQDPEMRYTPSGQPVAKFTVATNREWKGADGERKTATDWHNIEVWGKLAEISNQYLAKGRQVYVQGRLQTDKYDDKDGNTKWFTKVVAQEVKFLGTKPDGAGSVAPEEPAGSLGEDEIPF
jgi:single-strand DNA-binding protein